MIRFRRPDEPPEVLRSKGVAKRKAHAEKLADAPDDKLNFDGEIYGDATVKSALMAAQHGKCAFCEQRAFEARYLDVEHFRPKGAVRQSRASARSARGYWWLAYEWTNLLLACEQCNTDFKGELFPLADPGTRATTPEADLSREAPLLVDPSSEDPTEFVRFRRHVAYAVDDNARGVATCETVGLNRVPLLRRREEHLAQVKALAFVARSGATEALRDRARAALLRLAQPDAEFSAMVSVYVVDETAARR
jgi:uncharacterized protein (TIGR02646 family)